MPSCCCLPGKQPEGINSSELDISHFAEVGRLGEGGFGLVLLMEKLSKPAKARHFAVKKMSKGLITSHGLYAEVHQELKVAQRLSNPFLCRHFAAFQDAGYLYLVLELVSGGNLAHQLDTSGPIVERRIRFYAACLTLALAHMRSVGVVHRDMKPTNILLRADGYIVLADFGLAAMVDQTQVCSDDRARLVGTHGYVAPELYRDNHRHSFASDCYSLGVVLYECSAGTMPTAVPRALAEQSNTGVWVSSGSQRREKPPPAPFSAEKLELYASQLSGVAQVTQEFADCVARLLLPDARTRLGSASLSELKKHPWLEPLDWTALRHRRVPPPWLPPDPAPGVPQPGEAKGGSGGAQLGSDASKETRYVANVPGVANFQTMRQSQGSSQEPDTPSQQHGSRGGSSTSFKQTLSSALSPRGSFPRLGALSPQKSGGSDKFNLSAQDLAQAQHQFVGYTWNVQLRSRFLPKSASFRSMAQRGSSARGASGRNAYPSVFSDDAQCSVACSSQIHSSASGTPSNVASLTGSSKGPTRRLTADSQEPSPSPSRRLTGSMRLTGSRRGKNSAAVAPITEASASGQAEQAPSAAAPQDHTSHPEDLFTPAHGNDFAESMRDMFSGRSERARSVNSSPAESLNRGVTGAHATGVATIDENESFGRSSLTLTMGAPSPGLL